MAMPKGPQAFPRTEYLRRLSAVKAEMKRQEIEVLIVTVSSNITYLSGYTARSGYVPQGLIVCLKDEEPCFIVRRCDAPSAKYEMFIDNSRIIGYPESLVGNREMDGFDAVSDFLRDNGLASTGVGLEMKFLPHRSIGKFKAKMPQATLVDFTDCVTWLRLIKSDLEIAIMKEAAAIADAGILRAKEVIRPGVREADAAAEIIATLVRGVNGKPGTDVSDFHLCASPLAATPHTRWSEDVLHQGSQVNFEFGAVRYGYVSALSRTFMIGKPSERLRRVHEGEVAGMEAALAVVRPGITCGDIATAFNSTIKKYGFEKETRCGYSIGIDWLEPTASIKESDRTVLQPNMTFHLLLNNWIDEDFGYALSETFRVTETGAEVFTTLPREIFVM
ncbi:M24 family metallopeptidase [Bradyrhizobium icense]|uniref:Hydrolase n=1 Tax=Bradyrhizobium icense TaxID=1274631 RepID=A0A1B1UJQ6_9BRAD|nr:Xaa-Pro peptidase family protein [Bradyrhizobium icense]ANW02985.1 hydrolase [Bradyrhizobium icense]